ncbi:CsbD family protein [Streptomyces sp. NPDC101194]|uniref:CsbD family protein n=1 Tax=Streptomyces sp. NPDC101194 TaxID=3366127 RepID=UPI0037FBEE57
MVDEGSKGKIEGRAEEPMGRTTGDRRKGAEGKADQAEDAASGLRERAAGVQGVPRS